MLQAPISFLILPFLIKCLSERIIWNMPWGQHLRLWFLLSIPSAPGFIQSHPFPHPDIKTTLQLLSLPSLLSDSALFSSGHFLTYNIQWFLTAYGIHSRILCWVLHKLNSVVLYSLISFFPLHWPSLQPAHPSVLFQFFLTQPSISWLHAHSARSIFSPTLTSIYLSLAHVYELGFIRNNRD